MSKPTAGWERIGDRFYRKIELYRDVFDPELELENYSLAGAPCSGAVGKHSPQLDMALADPRSTATRSLQGLLVSRPADHQSDHRHPQLRRQADSTDTMGQRQHQVRGLVGR